MSDTVKIILDISIIFILVFLFNYFVFVRKNKKLKKDEMPLELIYLSSIYDIDPQKINFRRFQFTYCFLNSIIITTTYGLVIYLVNGMIFKVIIGIVILILLIIICYGLLGRYYLHKQEKESTKK